MKKLNLYTIKERQPRDGESIFIFGCMHSFGSDFFDPQFIKVEYAWVGVDDDGDDNGNQVYYEAGKAIPEGYRLALIDANNGEELQPSQLYALPSDINDLEAP